MNIPRGLAPVVGAGAVAVLAGCASVASLPSTPEEVVLDPGRFEQGYWPRYTASATLQGVSKEQALAAGRAALGATGFTILRDDPDKLVLTGEHGPTLFYWNVMAGVYFVERGSDIQVKVVSVGSKDIGFVELWPNPFPGRLVQGIEQALGLK